MGVGGFYYAFLLQLAFSPFPIVPADVEEPVALPTTLKVTFPHFHLFLQQTTGKIWNNKLKGLV